MQPGHQAAVSTCPGAQCCCPGHLAAHLYAQRRRHSAAAGQAVRTRCCSKGSGGSQQGPVGTATGSPSMGVAAIAAAFSAATAAAAQPVFAESTASTASDAAAVAAAAAAAAAASGSYVPGPVEVGWEIWVGFFAGVIPFVIASWEFGKRVVSGSITSAAPLVIAPLLLALELSCWRLNCCMPVDQLARAAGPSRQHFRKYICCI